MFKKTIEINPSKENAYLSLSQLYQKNYENFTKSEQILLQLLEKNPKNESAYKNLGILYENDLKNF